MTVEQFLQQNTRKLNVEGVNTARLDILILMEDCLNKNRTHILAHPDLKLSIEQILWLDLRVARRARHEPLSFIRGKTEFYGREFVINKNVLEPRPESETMVELLLEAKLPNQPKIVDIGTGSGAIGITAKLELPTAKVSLVEIDQKAMAVARQNIRKLGVDVQSLESDLLAGTRKSYDVILANLPYVPDDYHINAAAANEPRIAIFGGKDGLDVYRRLFIQLAGFSWQPKIVLTESLPPQHVRLAKIARSVGFKLTKTSDFIQQFENI